MRILILRYVAQNSMDDILHQTDYQKYEWIKSTNVGNKLWLMGLISTISTPENQIDFLQSYMDADYINANYDICIKPEANIFSPRFRDGMERHVQRWKDVKIPIYVIACGAAAKSYDELDELCSSIREPATAFIRSVYNTGGEFCLRGHFTKEMFNRLGFYGAVVTGCPSLYQNGRDLKISDEKVSYGSFKAALNGTLSLTEKAMKKTPKSIFIDQGLFYPILFAPEYDRSAADSLKLYGSFGIKMLEQDRIKLWVDLQDWADYLLSEDISFSCGSRIHGNILPILCGIPAAICPPDARVREMAEFYEIPLITESDLKKRDLYEIYSETNYTVFNRNFSEKYDAYETFLRERGIVKQLSHTPMLRTHAKEVNTDRLSEIQQLVQTQRIREVCNKVRRNPTLQAYGAARKLAIEMIEFSQKR